MTAFHTNEPQAMHEVYLVLRCFDARARDRMLTWVLSRISHEERVEQELYDFAEALSTDADLRDHADMRDRVSHGRTKEEGSEEEGAREEGSEEAPQARGEIEAVSHNRFRTLRKAWQEEDREKARQEKATQGAREEEASEEEGDQTRQGS